METSNVRAINGKNNSVRYMVDGKFVKATDPRVIAFLAPAVAEPVAVEPVTSTVTVSLEANAVVLAGEPTVADVKKAAALATGLFGADRVALVVQGAFHCWGSQVAIFDSPQAVTQIRRDLLEVTDDSGDKHYLYPNRPAGSLINTVVAYVR